ncbi:hypothetical protein SIM91_01020 [Rhodococcus opacus]|uniref:hypothetical protein n=1 Tax=Rhodococcus opacus TaxID=37919 RepID=UPI0029C1F6EE|nr:hypothetical protein [Rhodococcus opacus]MDX5961939.1 hypothetical protein [Rhodococcus opacus]
MTDPHPDPDSHDDPGVGDGHGSTTRGRPRVIVFGIILVKLGIIALILLLPGWLGISLAVGHGAVLVVLLVAAAVTLSVPGLRGRLLGPTRSRRPPHAHGIGPALRSAIVPRNKRHK